MIRKESPAPRLRNPLTEAGVNFSIAAVLPVILSIVVIFALGAAMGENYQPSKLYGYLAYLLPQVCFAVAALVFFRRTRTPARKVYAPCKWQYYVLALALAFGLLFALGILNTLFIGLLERIGYTPLESQPDYVEPLTEEMLTGWYLLPTILIIAVLPAIFEETIFRGIQVYTLKESGWGTVPTVLLCGAMFSLFHGNPEQTIYQFICGACYALLAIRSGSPLPSMLAHFLNNAIVIILSSVLSLEWFSPEIFGLLFLSATVALVIAVVFLIRDKKTNQTGGIKRGGAYFLAASVGIVVCVVEWLAMFVQGLLA